VIGTPIYMSPSSAESGSTWIHGATFSARVLLYELLTGMTAARQRRLRTAGFDEIRRIIREEDPATPSTRNEHAGKVGATVSANRQSDTKRLSQLFRSELDWIVMKALEKDRNRRYETAGASRRMCSAICRRAGAGLSTVGSGIGCGRRAAA